MKVGNEALDLLHFAPEHALDVNLARLPSVRRTTADLDGEGVDIAVDITAMPFGDEAFDAVVCSHVLEHVPDDRAAMSELCRVLRPGGWALVMVPVDQSLPETYEDSSAVTPDERERAFWQHDHVRLYGLDLADRLSAAGLEVRTVRVTDTLRTAAAERYGLLAGETVFHCLRPALS